MKVYELINELNRITEYDSDVHPHEGYIVVGNKIIYVDEKEASDAFSMLP